MSRACLKNQSLLLSLVKPGWARQKAPNARVHTHCHMNSPNLKFTCNCFSHIFIELSRVIPQCNLLVNQTVRQVHLLVAFGGDGGPRQRLS